MSYCLPADVASHLRLTEQDGETLAMKRLTFSTSTDPTLAEVTEWIEQADAEIDGITGRSFGGQTQVTEHHKVSFSPNPGRRGYVIQLNHSDNTVIDPLKGDRVEYFSAPSTWTDKTHDDGWELLSDGRLLIAERKAPGFYGPLRIYPPQGRIRVTYRHGVDSVPRDIKLASTLMVANRFLSTDLYFRMVPNQMDMGRMREIIERQERQVERILERYRGWVVL